MLKAAVFDDEPIVLTGVKAMIDWERFGIELIGTAADGHAAYALFREKRPEIIFTDIRMPGRDGLQLVEDILREVPDTVCVVFSGFNEYDFVKRAIQLGVCDYLEKPITIPGLERSIRKAMDHYKQRKAVEELQLRMAAQEQEPPVKAQDQPGEQRLSASVRARCYIEKHCFRDLTLDEVAGHVGMSPTYFSALFKEETGESYIKFVTRCRMEKAKSLLSKGLRVHEVSEKIGYHTYRHFSEVFKKHTGMTPGQYRDQISLMDSDEQQMT